MKKKLLRIFSSVLCLCMLTTACGGGTEDAGNGDDGGEAKDTLTIAVQADMADKDPINGSSTNDTLKIKANVYETLIERTVPEGEYKPLLAESWEFNDDATELTMTLREGVMCHNGEPLTAEDCLFSLRCLRESSNTSVTDHMDLENSYAVDERTFVIVMDEPYMPVIANLSFPTCVMFSQKGYEEGNGDWANMDIGTGPYTWGEWSIGSSVSLVGFDDYYVEGQPAIKNVEFRVISEDGNRYIEVETGGADMCYNLSGVDMRLSDLLSVTDEMMDYLKGDRENLNVEAVIGGVQREFFNAKEKRHMQDVRELFLQGLALRRGAVFVGVLAAAFLCLKKRQAVLLRMLQWGIAGVLCTMLGLGALISMDFTKYFTYFHLIFFDNMDWYLNPKTDLLINIVPEGFFRDTALRIAGMFLAVSLLFWLMAGALRRRLK